MPNSKQRREAERRRLQRRIERERAALQRRKQRVQIVAAIAAVTALLAVVVVALVLTGGGGDDKDTTAEGTTTCTFNTDGKPAAKPVIPPVGDDVPTTGTDTATLTTNQGVIALTVDSAKAPCTVRNFISLANQKFFDGTVCHRLSTSAGLGMLQCGDPLANGTGGPGYRFDDELSGTETYPRGTLAMANSGPNTQGSQFFLVFADSQLSANYTVFGTIDEAGLAVLDKIATAGVSGEGTDGPPELTTTIETVTLASEIAKSASIAATQSPAS